jgi:hypothetical protein
VNYYDESTNIELISRREPLETAAALNIGLLVFAFSRLELSLERYLERLSPQPQAATPEPQAPLQRLMAFVDRLPDPALRAGFRQWMARIHGLEGLRSAISTGRWIPDRRRECLVLDASPAPVKPQYQISELVAALASLKALQASFQELCVTEQSTRFAATPDFLSTQPLR